MWAMCGSRAENACSKRKERAGSLPLGGGKEEQQKERKILGWGRCAQHSTTNHSQITSECCFWLLRDRVVLTRLSFRSLCFFRSLSLPFSNACGQRLHCVRFSLVASPARSSLSLGLCPYRAERIRWGLVGVGVLCCFLVPISPKKRLAFSHARPLLSLRAPPCSPFDSSRV